ncbi:MAG: hypothetical protein MH252_00700 [Thermosynechococcaceae cyanobacterium MS004]|nr:hypothetical protein [Thermosynechococcaceae cyanobacterium MS004]
MVALMVALPFLPPGFACSRAGQSPRAEEAKVNTSNQNEAALGIFQPIEGTPYLMASLDNVGSRSEKLSTSGSYWTGDQSRNLVFLDTNTLESHRLFETNAYVIVQTDRYSQEINGKAVTQWLVYQVLKADTNGNRYLDQKDLRTLGISSANGKEYVEVLAGVTDIFGITMVKPGKLVVVYGKDKIKTSSIINLDERKVITTKPLIDLGSEVK